MNPEVEAAVIAGIVSIVSLGGTVTVAIFGFRTTVKATKMTADEAHTDTAATLEAQRVQLDETLREQHIRTLNERFATATEKLGSDKPPAVRLAGVYAMAGLADDWEDNRQTCVDVLCAYLRLRYARKPGAGEKAQMAFLDDREVRHTAIRVITAHLSGGATVSWQGLNFDFTGVVFDGGNFGGAKFSGGTVDFSAAEFPGPEVSFTDAEFSGGTVSFGGAQFSGGTVSFTSAVFSGGTVDFRYAVFSGGMVDFRYAVFSGAVVMTDDTQFSGAEVSYDRAVFSGGTVGFGSAKFSGGTVDFSAAEFSGAEVDFGSAVFSGGTVSFGGTQFSGATVDFSWAEFTGGTVDFGHVGGWSHPPRFDWNDEPPAGVILRTDIGGEAQ